jgi:hypothetical protein
MVVYVTAFGMWAYDDQQKKKQLMNSLANGYPPRDLPFR